MAFSVATLHSLKYSHLDLSLNNFMLMSESRSASYPIETGEDNIQHSKRLRAKHTIAGTSVSADGEQKEFDEASEVRYRLVLIDLGLLRGLPIGSDGYQMKDHVIAGKPLYLPPEVQRGRTYLTAVDNFALGVCGMLLLGGRLNSLMRCSSIQAKEMKQFFDQAEKFLDQPWLDLLKIFLHDDPIARGYLPDLIKLPPLARPADGDINVSSPISPMSPINDHQPLSQSSSSSSEADENMNGYKKK